MMDETRLLAVACFSVVPYVAPTEQGSAKEELSPTPFEAFMGCLLAEAPTAHAVLAGSAEWVGPPVLEMVMHGLWTVMAILGEKIAEPLRTDTQAWTDLAPRVDRLVGIGMLLVHGTPEAAAEAFRTEVLGSVERVLASFPVGTAILPQRVWGEASTKFFTTLLRRCGEERQRLQMLSARLDQVNRFPSDAYPFSYVEAGSLQSLALIARELMDYAFTPAELPFLSTGAKVPYVEVSCLVKRYQEQLERVRLMKLLPVALKGLPEGVLDGKEVDRWVIPTVDSNWLNTQVLLAALPNAPPELEYVDSESGPQFRKCLDQYDVETLCDRFWARMEARDPGIGANRAALESAVRASVKQCKETFRGHFDAMARFTAIVRFSADRSGITRENAYQVAAELDDAAFEKLFPKSDQERVGREELPALVDWGDLNQENFMEIITADRIPLDVIAAHVPKLNGEVRPSAVERIVTDERLDEKTAGILLDGGWVRLSFENLGVLVPHLSPARRKEALYVLLAAMRETPEELQEFRWPAFRAIALELALALPAEDQNELYGAAEFRSAVLDLLVHGHCLANGVEDMSWRKGCALLKRWDASLIERFVLAAEVRYRDGIYEGREEADSRFVSELRSQCLPLWRDLADGWRKREDAILWVDIPVALSLSRKEGRALLATYDEDGVFRWLYAVDPNADERLVDFQARREAYYERKRQQGLYPLPPLKVPKAKAPAPKKKSAVRSPRR